MLITNLNVAQMMTVTARPVFLRLLTLVKRRWPKGSQALGTRLSLDKIVWVNLAPSLPAHVVSITVIARFSAALD